MRAKGFVHLLFSLKFAGFHSVELFVFDRVDFRSTKELKVKVPRFVSEQRSVYICTEEKSV